MAKHIRIPLAGIALSLVALAAAAQSPSAQAAQTRNYHIESQPLPAAVNDWADQAGMQVMWSAQMPGAQREAPEVAGRFSAPVALERVLQGSGLTFAFLDEQTVAIRLASAARQPSAASGAGGREARTSPPSQGEGTGADQKQGEGRREDSNQSVRGANSAAASKAETISEVVVTGTHIRAAVDSSVPLTVFTQAEIRATGATTVEQFVSRLPQNLGSISGTSPSGSFGSRDNPEAATGIDLRGLGAGTTLVLLNGRRLSLASGATTPDISLIPLGFVKRVEVLTDGASAIYGADAIGGVVNFILRDDLDGAETALEYGNAAGGDMRQRRVEQSFGQSWSRGSALLSYSFLDREDLDAADRSFASAAAPNSLVPQERRNNGLLTLRQELFQNTLVSLDALFSKRETQGVFSFPGTLLDRRSSEQKQHFAALEISQPITDGLSLSVSGSYAKLDFDLDTRRTLSSGNSEFSQDSASSASDSTAKIDGTLFNVPAGEVRFALGAGYTNDEYDSVNDSQIERSTRYVFGELLLPLIQGNQQVPLIHRLELSLASRYTDYSDFGSKVSPKVGLSWSPDPSWNIRGTYGRSFRAPALSQLDPASATYSLFPVALFGLTDFWSSDNSSQLLYVLGTGNPSLTAENAETFTVGADVIPESLPNLKLTATYFNIRYSDRIAVPDPTQGFAALASPNDFPTLFTQNPSAEYVASLITGATNFLNFTSANPSDAASIASVVNIVLDDRIQNLAVTKVDGIDLGINYGFSLPFGELSMGAQASYLLSYEKQTNASSPILGVLNTVLNPVDLRLRTTIGLAQGGFSGQLGLNYVDGYHDDNNTLQPDIGSWLTCDVSLNYEFGAGKSRLLDDARMTLSAQNILDKAPPYVRVGATTNQTLNIPIGFDPTNADPTGRFVALTVTKRW